MAVVVGVLYAALPAAAQGELGALCSEQRPCADGLACRDGFCLRVADETPPPAEQPPAEAPPAEAPPAEAPPVEAPPPAEQPPAEAPPAEAPPAPATSTPPEPRAPATSTPPDAPAPTPAPTAEGDAEAPAEEPAQAAPAPAPEVPEQPVADGTGDEPTDEAPPSVADQLPPVTPAPDKVPGLSATQAKERAEDASGAVWGGAGGRAIAVPALACGSCLLGAGVCTTLGARRFVDAGERGEFPDASSNDEAQLGGNIATGVGVVMAGAGVPILIVGEGAVVYSAFTDWVPCSSGFALEDAALITLGVARALVWLVGSQLGAVGAGLCAGGVWAIAVSNAGRSFNLDSEAFFLFRGLSAEGGVLASVAAIPLGLGCVLGVLAAGLDLGTILRAGALEEEASERALTVRSDDVPAPVRSAATSTLEPAGAPEMLY